MQVSNGGDGTFPSYTHYAAVRKSAQEILWNYSNGNGIRMAMLRSSGGTGV